MNTSCNVTSASGSNRFPQISGIMASIPLDPINNASNIGTDTGNYAYMYGTVYKDGKSAVFWTKLENPNDPDRCGIQDYHRYTNFA